jgi:septum formation protein
MLLLASSSPARRRLLEQAFIPHRVRGSGVDEAAIADPDPRELVLRLARAKAESVRSSIDQVEGTNSAAFPANCSGSQEGDAITSVLGCDSLLVFEAEIFGKPRDESEARERWARMAGHWGELHTGHCLLPTPEKVQNERSATVTTRVLFAPLSFEEIDAYVATGEPLACAGGFALEGRGGLVVERIEGCFSNVIGLSLPLLRRWLGEDEVCRRTANSARRFGA